MGAERAVTDSIAITKRNTRFIINSTLKRSEQQQKNTPERRKKQPQYKRYFRRTNTRAKAMKQQKP
jgi:hypothetical protein